MGSDGGTLRSNRTQPEHQNELQLVTVVNYLRDGLGSHGSVATAGLVTGTVQGGVELTPAGVVEDVPLTFGIGQIIGLVGVILKLFFRSQSGRNNAALLTQY